MEGVLVVVLLVVAPPVVEREGEEQPAEDFGVGVRELLYFGCDGLEDLEAVEVLAEVELLLGLCNLVDEDGVVLALRAVDRLLEELYAIFDF